MIDTKYTSTISQRLLSLVNQDLIHHPAPSNHLHQSSHLFLSEIESLDGLQSSDHPVTKLVTRYFEHLDPEMIQASDLKSDALQAHPSDLPFHPPPPSRHRKIHLRPKFPKYEGLSNFAAPINLLSNFITPIPIYSSSNPPQLNQLSSSLSISKPQTKPKINSNPNPKSNRSRNLSNPSDLKIPIDFLNQLSTQSWSIRSSQLNQMAIDRRTMFLNLGFTQPDGQAFLIDEPFIERKPIPNRWVWYMRLSMEYDKSHHTLLPPGGPGTFRLFSLSLDHHDPCYQSLNRIS